MVHFGFCKKDNWYKEDYKLNKQAQERMIKSYYSDYKEGNYVLWIVAELVPGIICDKVLGSLEVVMNDGVVIPITLRGRRLYWGCDVYQISGFGKDGHLFGVPLVFETIDELMEIKQVLVKWSILDLDGGHAGRKNVYPVVNQIVVNYELDFELGENDERFFTLYTNDKFALIENGLSFMERDDITAAYFEEYDVILKAKMTNAGLSLSENEISGVQCRELSYAKGSAEVVSVVADSEPFDVSLAADCLGDISPVIMDGLLKRAIVEDNRFSKDINKLKNVDFYQFVCYKKQTLAACYMADIATDMVFGFQHHNSETNAV